MSNWIPVIERLPNENQDCYISDGKEVKIAWYGKRTSKDSTGFRFTTMRNITHWKPLDSAASGESSSTRQVEVETLRELYREINSSHSDFESSQRAVERISNMLQSLIDRS